MRKHIVIWLLAAAMALCVMPAAAAAESSGDVPRFVPGLTQDGMEDLELSYPKARNLKKAGNLPDRYPEDGDYKKYATSVKNQGVNGLCWDYSMLAVMESNLKKNGKGEYDFSEVHMSYAMSNRNGNDYGEDRDPGGEKAAGNCYFASTYLMRGMPGGLCVGGAVAEGNDPMTEQAIQYGLPERSTSVTFSGKPKYIMPQNIYFINQRKGSSYDSTLNSQIKEAVMTYGSVGAGLEWSDTDGTYNPSTAAHYRPWKGKETNHQVQIVGWDDSYSRYNFTTPPPQDGAWRVKNSWGTTWGDSGYGWVSYCDAWFPDLPYTIDGTSGYDSSELFTHEWDTTVPEQTAALNNTDKYLRYFEGRTDEVVSEVMVFLGSADKAVDVDVIQDLNATDMNKYTFQSRGSVSAHYPGWYTIKLSKPALVHKGQIFAVVIRTSSSLGVDTDYNGCTGFCADGNWYINNPVNSYGWCIKAKTTTEPDLINICAASDQLSTNAGYWSWIRGENTDINKSVTRNITPPGNGPYGTTFSYTDIDNTAYLTSQGVVTRPSYDTGNVTVHFGMVVSNASYRLTLSNLQLVIGAYGGKLNSATLPAKAHRNNTLKSVVMSSGTPGTLKYQWYSAASKSGAGTPISGATSASYKIPKSLSAGTWYYFVATASDATGSVTSSRCFVRAGSGTDKHTYGKWSVKKKATELAGGTRTRKCTICGAVQTQKTKALKPSLPAVRIVAPKAGKRSMTVRWTKVSKTNQKKVKKIQIQYCLRSNFKSGVKTTYAKSAATSKTVKGLKKGKRYYIRLRAYTKKGKTVHISKWSAKKSVKVK